MSKTDETVTDPEGSALPEKVTPEIIDGPPVTPPQDEFSALIQSEQANTLEDPEAVSRQIVAGILNAGSVEEILTQPEVRHAREMLDQPVVIHGVHFNRSEFENGPEVYAIVDVADPDTGDVFAVSCGGRNVMAQLYRLSELGAFPVTVKFTQARKPTRGGFYPLWLVKG